MHKIRYNATIKRRYLQHTLNTNDNKVHELYQNHNNMYNNHTLTRSAELCAIPRRNHKDHRVYRHRPASTSPVHVRTRLTLPSNCFHWRRWPTIQWSFRAKMHPLANPCWAHKRVETSQVTYRWYKQYRGYYYYILTQVLNSQGMKKLRYAIQKSTKIKLERTLLILLLLHKTVMQ